MNTFKRANTINTANQDRNNFSEVHSYTPVALSQKAKSVKQNLQAHSGVHMIPSAPLRKRNLSNYISTFDDKFKVDLNFDDTPSISAISQRAINFTERADKLKNKAIGITIIAALSLVIIVNLLIDLGFLNPKTNLLTQYFNEFPFLLFIFLVFLYISMLGLKIFKHN